MAMWRNSQKLIKRRTWPRNFNQGQVLRQILKEVRWSGAGAELLGGYFLRLLSGGVAGLVSVLIGRDVTFCGFLGVFLRSSLVG